MKELKERTQLSFSPPLKCLDGIYSQTTKKTSQMISQAIAALRSAYPNAQLTLGVTPSSIAYV